MLYSKISGFTLFLCVERSRNAQEKQNQIILSIVGTHNSLLISALLISALLISASLNQQRYTQK